MKLPETTSFQRVTNDKMSNVFKCQRQTALPYFTTNTYPGDRLVIAKIFWFGGGYLV